MLIGTFILFAVLSVVFFAVYKFRQSDDYAKYTEKGYSSYDVILKEDYNPYGNGIDTSNMQYLSSKLEGLNANLYYKLNMKESDIEYKYTYTLKEVAHVVSKDTGKTIISYQKEIKKKTVNAVKSNELKIEESHYLDYAYHDTKITQFINQQSDLRTHAVTCTLKLVLEINLKGVCQDFEDEFSKHPTVYISVPLTTDTVSITSGSNITKGEGKIILCKNLSNDKPYLTTAYVFGITAVLLIVAWYVYGKLTMSQDDKFVKTTNKIKSNYGSYIQQISKPISQDYEHVVEFNKFVDLLEVSNIIKQPVFVEKKTDDEIVYVVPESSTRIYMFRLNKESFAKKENSTKIEDLDRAEKQEKIKDQPKVEEQKKVEVQDKKQEGLEKTDELEQSPKEYTKKEVKRPIKIKKEKPNKTKKENLANKQKPKKVKQFAVTKESISEKPAKVENSVKSEHKIIEKTTKPAKVNKSKKTTVSKKQSRKQEIFKIIESDLQKLDKNAPMDKTVNHKSEQGETSANNQGSKKSALGNKPTAKKSIKKSSGKPSAVKIKQKSTSPTAVNLSFDGVEAGKVINVSIETTEDKD